MTRSSRPLRLDPARRKFLGVCAGLANYLDVEPWSVRLVYIGCCIFGGWFLIPLYFVVWFLLDEASSGVRASLADNLAVKHFRTVDYRKKIYRNRREAKWLGICAGLADYLEVNVFAVRVVFLLLFFTTGGFALLFYLAAWMVLDEPPTLPGPDSGRAEPAGQGGRPAAAAGEFHSRRRELAYCARKLGALQERLARMEAYVTSNRFRLHREFRNIS